MNLLELSAWQESRRLLYELLARLAQIEILLKTAEV